MNLLDIDIQDYIPDIVEAYTKVYGAEYRDIIAERMSKVCFVMYNNVEGISGYENFLKNCKKRELAIKFLEQIGIDVSKQQGKSYAENLDDSINILINQYIGGYLWGISTTDRKNIPIGIGAWGNLQEGISLERVQHGKIQFINFLRGQNVNPITKESFHEFCETEEYKQISEKVNEYLKVYNLILEEYDRYSQELEPYQKYIEDEKNRSYEMESNTRNSLYTQVLDFIPNSIKTSLEEKYDSINEQSKALIGMYLGIESYIEFFSEENENKLNDSSINEDDKSIIYYNRVQYFQKIGVGIDESMYDFDTYREFFEYCIQQEHIKKLIPSPELAMQIKQLRTKAYEEFQKDFIYSSKEFIENAKKIDDSDNVRMAIYERQKDNMRCVTAGLDDETNEILPLLFFTVINTDGGRLDYILLHELGHANETKQIFKEKYSSGFETMNDVNMELNPYNRQERKYERFNETIVDIFAIEARQALHEKGVYILEPKEIIVEDVKDYNTHSIVKNLVTRLLEKYRESVIRARIFGDMSILYDAIGKENFEELNDVVNRVDSLDGLQQKLLNNQNNDPAVVEYRRQLERLEQIYANIEIHQSRASNNSNLLRSAISATEESTRQEKINEAQYAIMTLKEYSGKDKEGLNGVEIDD